MTPLPHKIVSGGQTGADRAGLDFAIANNISHGGWCPKGRKAEDGPIPSQYQLTETESADYPERTNLNVRDSDLTVIFNPGCKLSNGSLCTIACCHAHAKPYVILHGFSPSNVPLSNISPDAESLAAQLCLHAPSVLNVAGNRERIKRGIGGYVQRVLERAWALAPALAEAAAMANEREPHREKQALFKF